VRLPVILYKEGDTLNQLVEYVESGEDGNIQNVEIRIPGHLVSSVNRKVRSRQLWGSDVYTSDSDLVAVLMHCGYIHHTSTLCIFILNYSGSYLSSTLGSRDAKYSRKYHVLVN